MRTERSMRIQVVGRNGKEIFKGGVEVPEEGTFADLKKAIQRRNSKYYPDRQRITLPQQPGQPRATTIENTKKLKDCFITTTERPQVVFKDLGPQVSYKTLFFMEYLGPLLIYPLFYYYPQIYTNFNLPERTFTYPIQTYALYLWSFHYLKREFETFCVHRFSHSSSPLANVYRNCAYYWAFAGFIAYFVNHPSYRPVSDGQMKLGIAISVASQVCNLYCHVLLRGLRDCGKSGYQIPQGFLFEWVTCANYSTEILQWVGFNIATQTVAGYLFLTAATYIMTVWAVQKHRRLKKMFDGQDGRKKYPQRWVILPPFI